MERPRFPGALRSSLCSWMASLAALALVPALAFGQANGKLQIHHIKVGQGDGTLLISPLGQKALFDDGVYTNCTEIKSYLQSRGITTVDYHFTSHYHADHIGCIDDLAAIGITIGTAGYDRGSSYSSATYTSYVNTLGARRQTIAQNQVITLDAGSANPVYLKCVALNGAGVYSPSGSDENAKSVVMKVSYGAFDEVIGGDLTGDPASGNDVETTVGPLVGDVEVYKVHHHGSRYSSNNNWLNAIDAEVGIIMTGDGNTYGHPTADALNRMHAVNMKTYWTETGAGATPNPAWDKVANGAVVVQADPGASDNYTVSGPGFADTYTNGGGAPPPPPINTTEFPSALTMLKGTLATGDVTRLALSDDSRIGVSAGVTGGQYYTDWYGTVFLAHPPLNLTVKYEGSFTVTRTQTLYLWNFTTGIWDQINSGSVGTTDVVKTHTPSAFANYVSASREVRFRVKGNNRNSTYTSRGDLMSFNYDYAQGTAPQSLVAQLPVDDHTNDAAAPRPVELPLQMLRRVSAEPGDGRVSMSWAVGLNEHVDGFNIYRENADGVRVHMGYEAGLETIGDEAIFSFVDEHPESGVYWLGVRGCSAPEAMIGPIRVGAPAGGAAPGSLAFAIAPNPVRDAAGFALALDRAGVVRVDVFDVTGRRIATPFEGWLPAGSHRLGWNLRVADGSAAGPGIYFARLQGSGRTLMSRMTVVGR